MKRASAFASGVGLQGPDQQTKNGCDRYQQAPEVHGGIGKRSDNRPNRKPAATVRTAVRRSVSDRSCAAESPSFAVGGARQDSAVWVARTAICVVLVVMTLVDGVPGMFICTDALCTPIADRPNRPAITADMALGSPNGDPVEPTTRNPVSSTPSAAKAQANG